MFGIVAHESVEVFLAGEADLTFEDTLEVFLKLTHLHGRLEVF